MNNMDYKMGKEEGHVLINSWYFDFQNMRAYKDPEVLLLVPVWQRSKMTMSFTLHTNHYGGISRQYRHELIKIFEPPEDRFNDVVDEAFLSYVMEQQMLLSNLSETTS